MVGRIVVASCDVQRRKEIRAALEFEGHRVAEGETARQTLQETCSGAHDVLLLDSEIKGAKLHELCRAIRPRSDLGIIVLNRDDTGQARIDALNSGADDCVAGAEHEMRTGHWRVGARKSVPTAQIQAG